MSKKTVAEQVYDFIDKNTEKERGKWEAGMANRYLAWDDFRESWASGSVSRELKDLREQCSEMAEYIKAKGLEREYKEWRGSK